MPYINFSTNSEKITVGIQEACTQAKMLIKRGGNETLCDLRSTSDDYLSARWSEGGALSLFDGYQNLLQGSPRCWILFWVSGGKYVWVSFRRNKKIGNDIQCCFEFSLKKNKQIALSQEGQRICCCCREKIRKLLQVV